MTDNTSAMTSLHDCARRLYGIDYPSGPPFAEAAHPVHLDRGASRRCAGWKNELHTPTNTETMPKK
jgi:hypothetical protein